MIKILRFTVLFLLILASFFFISSCQTQTNSGSFYYTVTSSSGLTAADTIALTDGSSGNVSEGNVSLPYTSKTYTAGSSPMYISASASAYKTGSLTLSLYVNGSLFDSSSSSGTSTVTCYLITSVSF